MVHQKLLPFKNLGFKASYPCSYSETELNFAKMGKKQEKTIKTHKKPFCFQKS